MQDIHLPTSPQEKCQTFTCIFGTGKFSSHILIHLSGVIKVIRLCPGRRCERKALPRHAARRIHTIGQYATVVMPAWPRVAANQALCHSRIWTHVSWHLSTFLLFLTNWATNWYLINSIVPFWECIHYGMINTFLSVKLQPVMLPVTYFWLTLMQGASRRQPYVLCQPIVISVCILKQLHSNAFNVNTAYEKLIIFR